MDELHTKQPLWPVIHWTQNAPQAHGLRLVTVRPPMQASEAAAVVVVVAVVVTVVDAAVEVVAATVVASVSKQIRPKVELPTGTVFGNAVQLSWQSPPYRYALAPHTAQAGG